MRAAWRLAISNLSGRGRRTALLAGAVALSCALVVGVACAMQSIQVAIHHQLAATVGAGDVRLKPAASGVAVPAALLETVRAWPGVARAEGRLQATATVSGSVNALISNGRGEWVRKPFGVNSSALVVSLPEGAAGRRAPEGALVPAPDLIAGRYAESPDEVVIDDLLSFRLTFLYSASGEQHDGFFLPGAAENRPPMTADARPALPERVGSLEEADRLSRTQGLVIGDEIEMSRGGGLTLPIPGLRKGIKVKIVGIAALPPLGGRPTAYMTSEGVRRIAPPGDARGFTQIDIGVAAGVAPESIVEAHRAEMPAGVILQTTDKITSGLDRNIQSSQLGMVLATVMAFLAAAFIITTGLSTAVTERERELAIVRCIGGRRGQLAGAQLLIGGVVGALGGVVGVPLGVGLAWLLSAVFRDQLPKGLAVSWWGIGLALSGALLAGLGGAAWPAWKAARVSPLSGLAARSVEARGRGVVTTTIVGLAMLGAQALIVGVPGDGQVVFWGYATAGMPLMFVGYFLLGVPTVVVAARVAAGPVARLLRVPARVLARTVEATPYRHGFTAGSLMAGLALMIAIWTNGGAMMRDWLDKIQFPDAFVSGPLMSEAAQKKLASMPVVADTCAITLFPVETDVFGVKALQRYKTTFVGFEPESFFRMARLTWVQGDEATAVERLKRGGAVIVAREFLTAQGLGVGHTFTCTHEGVGHRFEIVGVVASPGLEIVSKFFNVGDELTDQSVHAVFGSREDMKAKFFGGQPAPAQLIQIKFSERVAPGSESRVLDQIRRDMSGLGVLDVGSGVEIKQQVRTFASGVLVMFSSVAFAAMLIACFGVANLVVAGVEARRFEFGVLRAIGAGRGVLARLVAGEAVLVALAASLLGTLMGLQGAWAGQRLYGLLLGLELRNRAPLLAVVAGCAIVLVLALLASWPAIWRLNRRHPRELLASVRG